MGNKYTLQFLFAKNTQIQTLPRPNPVLKAT